MIFQLKVCAMKTSKIESLCVYEHRGHYTGNSLNSTVLRDVPGVGDWPWSIEYLELGKPLWNNNEYLLFFETEPYLIGLGGRRRIRFHQKLKKNFDGSSVVVETTGHYRKTSRCFWEILNSCRGFLSWENQEKF